MKANRQVSGQDDLFQVRLEKLLDPVHAMVRLAHAIDWGSLDDRFGKMYAPTMGAPAKPTRLMVGLHYLKHTFDLSDEEVVARWVENPYWQYFCGMEYFEYEMPIDPSSMTRWRQRIKSDGMEKLLSATIQTALQQRVISKRDFRHVNVDTTVQEKAVALPTDSKLYHKAREHLVKAAVANGIQLRQNYMRLSKYALVQQGRYRRASQMRRAKREVKKLKKFLGCVYRDISRKIQGHHDLEEKMSPVLEQALRLLNQERHSKNKLYSLHAPEVECIAKGKAHKKYEFGCKAGIVATSKRNFIIGLQAFHGNPYDGHTLQASLDQAERLSQQDIKNVYVDLGYRKHDYQGATKIHIVKRSLKNLTRSFRNWCKRRNAIEPIIGHTKNDGRLGRNYLKGKEGDKTNAILCACGYNIRKLLKAFFLPLWNLYKISKIIVYSLFQFKPALKTA